MEDGVEVPTLEAEMALSYRRASPRVGTPVYRSGHLTLVVQYCICTAWAEQ
jgi:hypothetical protein